MTTRGTPNKSKKMFKNISLVHVITYLTLYEFSRKNDRRRPFRKSVILQTE